MAYAQDTKHMLNEITLLQACCLTSRFTSYKVGYSKRRSIKFDIYNDNNDTTGSRQSGVSMILLATPDCLLPVLVSDCLLAPWKK